LEQPAARYTGAVADLLGLGAPPTFQELEAWLDYEAMGIGERDIPDLIALATDRELHWADGDDPRVWGPLHAWRALAQLRAADAVRPLVQLVASIPDDDWIMQELPQVFARIGPAALPPLKKILANPSRTDGERETVSEAIGRIGQRYPEVRAECAAAMRDRLADFARQSEDLNAFLVCALMDLGDADSIALIRRAYSAGAVEETLPGDIEDVELALGLRSARETSRAPFGLIADSRAGQRAPAPHRARRKVGRNEPCPCGSGKKYKRCCGAG
jgi:hypothetical protein